MLHIHHTGSFLHAYSLSLIPSQVEHKVPNPLEEPFIDIACGGSAVPGAEAGALAVWAVTVQGKVGRKSSERRIY
jgi:hypothetical protein